MSVDLNQDWIQDVRMPVAGDSFGWYAVEGKDVKDTLVIHHSASENDDAFSIANYHVNTKGWGGIGYHFVITKDGTVQYAGDLATMRAHVANQNQHKVGICLVGNMLNHIPTKEQLVSTKRLIDFLIAPNDILPKVNGYEAVTYHNGVVGQSTECPGWQSPRFTDWYNFLIGGQMPDEYVEHQNSSAPDPQPAHVDEPGPVVAPTEPPAPTPDQTKPTSDPILPVEMEKSMQVPAQLKSRKFWICILAALTFIAQGQYNQAMLVILGYFGVNVIEGK